MKDVYIIHGGSACGKTWFINNIVYDENIDLLKDGTISDFDFFNKFDNNEMYYRNVIIDEFLSTTISNSVEVLVNHRKQFDFLFIVTNDYSKLICDCFCRELIKNIYSLDNVATRIHVLDFNSGQNFNVRKW